MRHSAGRVPGNHYSLHGVGRSRVNFRHRRFHLTWVAVIVAVLAAPVTAAVACPPAVDQYTQHLPGAACGSSAGGETPVARLGLLPSKTLADLTGPDGRLLAQIATARNLGAPALNGSAGPGAAAGAPRGFASVVAATVGTGPSLALIGALAVIAIPGAWTRFTRRRRSPDQPL
jgi:hypothetical protein